jgi:GNAT superfamily N-acetyltransferase
LEPECKKVNKKLDEYKAIKDLMLKTFPKNEIIPMWILLLLSQRKMVDFNAYYDDNEFVGFSYSIINCNMIFIFYLAVYDKIQSNGYGTKILKYIKEKYKGKEIILNIEKIDKNSQNYEQRLKRLKFYKKNGFNETEYFIDDDIEYSILSTNKDFNKEEYTKTLKKYSFGLYNPKIKNI